MRKLLITILALTLVSLALWVGHRMSSQIPGVDKPPVAVPVPDPDSYQVTSGEMEYHRKKLLADYQAARTTAERKAVVQSARDLLELSLPEMMRCWCGTPWDFNGTATIPGEGKIACGYFVSTVMRDAGFRVERVRLAQQPSQHILRTFLPRQELTIRAGTQYDAFMDSVRGRPHGIYIIGLDKHVGFLVHNSDGLRFIHSGGLLNRVVDESQLKAHSIKISNYRV
ncbi:MAG: hypothetical protein ACPG6P_14280, partial [Akkermansiaceae bacterium]